MTMVIIQTVLVSTQNCLYDKHCRYWPNLDKVGEFGKHYSKERRGANHFSE